MASQRDAIAYEIVLNPHAHRRFGIGITDRSGRLWQFWHSPSNSLITITESAADDEAGIDFRPPRGHDFAVDLRMEQIDPVTVTAATLRRRALRWIKDRNADIASGAITV